MPSYNQNTTTKYPSIVVIHKNNVFIPKYAHSGSIKPSRPPLALSETDRDTEYHLSASIKTGRRSIHLVVRPYLPNCPSFGRALFHALLYALPSSANPSLEGQFSKIDLLAVLCPSERCFNPSFWGFFQRKFAF